MVNAASVVDTSACRVGKILLSNWLSKIMNDLCMCGSFVLAL